MTKPLEWVDKKLKDMYNILLQMDKTEDGNFAYEFSEILSDIDHCRSCLITYIETIRQDRRKKRKNYKYNLKKKQEH